LTIINKIKLKAERTTLAGVPEGLDALVLAQLAGGGDVLHIARDDARLARLESDVAYFAPEIERLRFPAWECLPYDRVSPGRHIQAQRSATLTRLGEPRGPEAGGRLILTTVSAVLQRVAPRSFFADASFAIEPGRSLDRQALFAYLEGNGFSRSGTVREPGEYAVRGGIIDLYAPDAVDPVRLDLFGEEIDSIRRFDPGTQKTIGPGEGFVLRPAGEVLLDDAATTAFRTGYRELFGAAGAGDPIYEAISAGRPFAGMEHWLPLFHDHMETLFDHVAAEQVTLDYQIDEAVEARLDAVADYYQARLELSGVEEGSAYRPLPPERLFLGRNAFEACLAERKVAAFSPFPPPEAMPDTVDIGGRPGLEFAAARTDPNRNLFDAVRDALAEMKENGPHPVIAALSVGSRDRLASVMEEHGIETTADLERWEDVISASSAAVPLIVLDLERGFQTQDFAIITEHDILGERLIRAPQRRRRAEDVLTELTSLEAGDLVVHVDHGVGRYEGLETIDAGGAPHDCLRVVYDGNDRLFVPVENMDVLSRYGAEDSAAQLDRLGGAGWQARKARVRERIKAIAGDLIKIAAERELRKGIAMAPPEGLFDEFAARFPYDETVDQRNAIEDVLVDLGSGRPMDRLVCGDVGFGKTEVALRAAFVAVMAGHQAAVVVPTTLLARQHYRTFAERFAGLPVKVAQISRLVTPKEVEAIKHGLADGSVDIVVGTHALLGKSINFKSLGLLVVDEEQHFGVKQKERLKELRADVHVLTLTATPIPRTLQMALSGVREMSLIATPPVDRLAVRSFVLPYDPVVLREAIEREIFRGGQVYYVCPRIKDIPFVEERLKTLVPDARIAVAHGQMPPSALEEVMSGFYDGKYQILLSTNIIESGLDIPTVNTIIIHRADMFGLAQLYQLRGRVGRSKTRAYAYLTIPNDRLLNATAERRLSVMQTLDSLGAGFTLASYDLDIRGAGNLLGEEQSGHIREVGIELYQQMLEEAVAAARDQGAAPEEGGWSPQISIGMPVLIPEGYVADLSVRLGLYRRISGLADRAEIESFAAELIDRFGALPHEVENLLEIVAIKQFCLAAGVSKVDAGPKGATLSFHENRFARPEKLVEWLSAQAGHVTLRPDHTLVYRRQWDEPASRLKGVQSLMKQIAAIAAGD
jgi:transcription-repair coupling factor (superfamily II helicase)